MLDNSRIEKIHFRSTVVVLRFENSEIKFIIKTSMSKNVINEDMQYF
jgi:hypothetical protein